MAKEKNLTTVTSVAAADFARLVTSAGASVKATAANLAKYIIETYNGSTVAGSAQSVKSALDSLNSNQTYKAGDTFNSRNMRAMGRAINSGKGIYCWIDFARPITASSATFNISFINAYHNGSTNPQFANTVSSVSVSGNELLFVLDTTNTVPAGGVYLVELTASITLT